jgi:hypothetical protein
MAFLGMELHGEQSRPGDSTGKRERVVRHACGEGWIVGYDEIAVNEVEPGVRGDSGP